MRLCIRLLMLCLVAWALPSCGDDEGPTGVNRPSLDTTCGSALADHVLITEIATTPTLAEYVEIHNPTSRQILLSNYYLYNATHPASPACRYYDIANSGTCGTTSRDFILQFPLGATINPGEYQVIALTTAGAYCEEMYPNSQCPLPDYEVFGNGRNTKGVFDMRGTWDTDIDTFVRFGFLDDTSEELILFEWDGGSAPVKDIDYVVWGSAQDVRADKTGVASYRPDTPVAWQRAMPGNIAIHKTYQRICLSEVGETKTGGNGITRHNETSENLGVSFVIADPTPGRATVGVGP